MKITALVCSLSFLLTLFSPAQPPKSFKTIDLNKAKIAGSTCQINLQDGLSSVIWLDEQHLVASSFSARCSSAPSIPPAAAEAVVFDITGSVQATDRRSGTMFFSKGPRGTIAALGSGEIELLDAQLHRQQTIECPNSSKGCGITLAPNSTFDSEFAVCSTIDQQEQVCDFYSGWPAVTFRQAKSQPENPYSHLVNSGLHTSWQVASGETWFFNNGRLTASDANKVFSPVSSEDFVGKEGGGCDGHLSEVEPRRFLAVCTGTHWYSDGMFDAIFGFSRVVLFDVSTRSVIKRIDGPAYVSASLSPSGKRVAILKGGKVRLYEAD
jgi:hypothetical protein